MPTGEAVKPSRRGEEVQAVPTLYESSGRNSTTFLYGIASRVCVMFSKVGDNVEQIFVKNTKADIVPTKCTSFFQKQQIDKT